MLRRKLVDAPMSSAREHALALLALLADAEARVHGTGVDNVHFHELGDWDSLMDLIAAGCIAAALAGARWTASAPPLGGGTVRTAHGLLPVPVPATALLLTGYPWRDDGVPGERVTPTGAAILRHLVPAEDCNARHDAGRLVSVGSGAGTRASPGLPNLTRALVFERAVLTDAAGGDADVVSILEFDVDDMTGEEIAIAGEHLRIQPGVIDVSIGTRQGKKGRPLADFRVLADPRATAAIARAGALPKPRHSACACVTNAGSSCAARRSRWSTTASRFASSSPNAPPGSARRRQRTTMSHRNPGSTGAGRRAKRRYGAR